MRALPRPLRLLALCVLLNAALFAGLRLALWARFRNLGDGALPADLLWSFYLGLKFDVRLALLMALPLLAVAWIPPLDPIRRRVGRWLWVGYWSLATLAVLFLYAVDFGNVGYLGARIDSTLVRFLEDPRESATMVWQSYPVVWGLLGLLVFTLLYAALVAHAAGRVARTWPASGGRRRVAAAILAFLALGFVGIYGKLSWYPLRWSDAFFSSHGFTSSLALNPVLYLYDTYKNRVIEFDAEATREHYATMVDFLGVSEPDPEHLDYIRLREGRPAARGGRPNVVIVLLESFAFYKTGVSGNPLNPTPHFDAVARQGILFRRFYTPHWGTARGVFTTVTSLPDVEPHRTSSRNPLIVRQHTLINAFDGYQKFYFIGGSASWGNIRGLLTHNVPDLRLYEEGSYSSPRVDVWGISDLHLLEDARQVLTEAGDRPFVAVIQTAGNHEPYTIPPDRRGFVLEQRSDDEVQRYGFKNAAAFDSYRFLDHALGLFFAEARKTEWFEDTIFVLTGDHGLPRRADHRPRGERLLSLDSFHVPLVIYAPGRIAEPRVVDEVASLSDLLPTVTGLARLPTVNASMGRDLFDPRYAKSRYAFVKYQEGVPRLGLIGQEFYFGVRADGSEPSLHRIYADDPLRDLRDELPQEAARMQELVLAIYETARYMRYHNSPEYLATLRGERDAIVGAAR